MRAAMFNTQEDCGTSSERGTLTSLLIGVIERGDNEPDVIVTAGEFLTLRSDLARVTAERDAARNGENEAMALVIGLEGTVHRVTEELRVARVDVGIVGLQSDGYRRERDALKARLDDYFDDHRAVVAGQCAPDERHCSCVPHLRREVEAMRAALRSSKLAMIQVKRSHAISPSFDLDMWATIDGAIREIDVIDKGEHLDALRTRKGGG